MTRTADAASRALITFLGTGQYETVDYLWEGYGSWRTAFASAAMARMWKAKTITVLATDAARATNGGKLEQALAEAGAPGPRFHTLAGGSTEQDQWQQFTRLQDAVTEQREADVLIDITHGFRAQPFMAAAVLAVLRAADRAPDKLHVAYGAYQRGALQAHIWNLDLFVELVDWAQALGQFRDTGNAQSVMDLVQRRGADAQKAIQAIDGRRPGLKSVATAIGNFADDLATVRIASIVTGFEQDARKKARAIGSAKHLLNTIERERDAVTRWLPPLALILEDLCRDLEPLVSARLYGAEGQRAQIALARFYLKLQRFPEAAIVMRESHVNRYAADATAVEVNDPAFSKRARAATERAFTGSDPSARTIADIRNDIEHGGFGPQPVKAPKLRRNLVAAVGCIDDAPSVAATFTATAPVRWFVSRHQGAVDWAKSHGVAVDRWATHLDVAQVREGDVVMGSLPVDLAAAVCERGAHYHHLHVGLPPEARGQELTAEHLAALGAELRPFEIRAVSLGGGDG